MMKVLKNQSRPIPHSDGSLSCRLHHARAVILLSFLILPLLISGDSVSQIKKIVSKAADADELKIARSAMCEEVKDGLPFNEGLTFSSDLGKIACYTEFDPVPERTVICHCWYFKDNLSTRRKLVLNPPRWSVFSLIQLRETEKGPWRVDITDEDGNILQTLRFSVTD
jgi:hypothetical protein